MTACRRCPIKLTKPPETLGEHLDDLRNRFEDAGLDPMPVDALRRYLLDRTMAAIAHNLLEDE